MVEEAIQTLEVAFEKADTDLQYVMNKLELEYSSKSKSSVNPIRLMQRLKRIQDDLPVLLSDCQSVMAAKQDLMEVCQSTLLHNRNSIHRIAQKAAVDVDTPDSRDSYLEFNSLRDRFNSHSSMPTSHYEPVLSSEALKFELIKVSMANKEDSIDEKENTKENSINLANTSNEQQQQEESPRQKVINRNSWDNFVPVTETEFMSVSELVRARCKLVDVNKVYETLWNYFKEKRGSKVEPLSVQKMSQLGCKITGQTGEARLATLRALKLIQISKDCVIIKLNKA